MKLLITANGFSHPLIIEAFRDLVGCEISDLHMAFVPTAANEIDSDKGWLIDDLRRCKEMGFASIDIIDIASVPRENFLPRMQRADVLLFGGGDNAYLYAQMKKCGLLKDLSMLLETKIYVGISAGSMITGPFAEDKISQRFFGEPSCGRLGFVPFWLKPHLNSPSFPERTIDQLVSHFQGVPYDTYFLDDESAVVVNGGDIHVVSGGDWYLMKGLK